MNKQLTICGLNLLDLRRFVGDLETLWHAVDENDWDRIEKKEVEGIKIMAGTIQKTSCVGPPHGLFDVMEIAHLLEMYVKSKNAKGVISTIAQFLFMLFYPTIIELGKCLEPEPKGHLT